MKKSTLRKAIVTSVLALVLCFAMLLGTTFAWFTDKASTGTNVIQSGNLDLVLNAKTTYNGNYAEVTDSVALLPADTLWEPGYAACIYAELINNGSLAFKYTLNIKEVAGATGAAETSTEASEPAAPAADLAEVIDVYYANREVDVSGRDYTGLRKLGTLKDVLDGNASTLLNDSLAAGAKAYATIVLVMQTTAGNAYQGLSIGDGFTIQVVATQAAVEEDAFGTDYDVSAEFPTD